MTVEAGVRVNVEVGREGGGVVFVGVCVVVLVGVSVAVGVVDMVGVLVPVGVCV